MKKFVLLICFSVFFAKLVFTQSVSVHSNVGDLYDGVDHVKQGFKVTQKRWDDGFIVVSAQGFISRGETFETILNKGKKTGNYLFELKKEKKPVINSTSKKILFSEFYSSSTIKVSSSKAYMWDGINIKDKDYGLAMSRSLTDWGFKTIIDDGDPFRNKNSVPDFAIAGDIARIDLTTKGTSSFEIALLVKWNIFDIRRERKVLIYTTGGYSNSKSKNNVKQDLLLALKDALKGLMVENEFLELVNNDIKIDLDNTETLTPLKLKGKALVKYTDYGKMIAGSIKSCVTIKTSEGHGSGFLISEDGYILTNYHVVSDASQLEVVFENGFKFPARLVRHNPVFDVALLKIEGSGFPSLSLDETDEQAVGGEVIAIGTPEDIRLGQTVTKGIVSSLRSIDGNKFIQTDVSINPGNSGGPLISQNGNVIGIVTSKISGEKIQGLGFAIPINFALEKLKIELIK